jgi:hypothetical protein
MPVYHLGAILRDLQDPQAFPIVWKEQKLLIMEHLMTSTLSCTIVSMRKLTTDDFQTVHAITYISPMFIYTKRW